MATNLKLDEQLLLLAFQLSGRKTRREAVTEALQEYVSRRQQRDALQLRNQIDFDPSYDYKSQRSQP